MMTTPPGYQDAGGVVDGVDVGASSEHGAGECTVVDDDDTAILSHPEGLAGAFSQSVRERRDVVA